VVSRGTVGFSSLTNNSCLICFLYCGDGGGDGGGGDGGGGGGRITSNLLRH